MAHLTEENNKFVSELLKNLDVYDSVGSVKSELNKAVNNGIITDFGGISAYRLKKVNYVAGWVEKNGCDLIDFKINDNA